jgi:glycerol-1-phosphate dehydrogenase [NAD(P)+]
VQAWCGREFACECGETHHLPTKQIVIEAGAAEQLEAVLSQCAHRGKVVCVSDANTHAAAGRRVAQALTAAKWDVTEVRLPDGCHAEERSLDTVRSALPDSKAAVAVGAGTINDLTKLAATEVGIPYLACPTAPSMNGFTSRVAAISVKGVKRTLPAAPPFAVVADLDVLCSAPADMIAAGLADLQARRCAASDWRLSSMLHDEYFCLLPFEMMRETEARCQEQAAGIRRAEPEAVATLTAGLLLSGFSMVVAGSSAPVSGGEHLLSHFWEMTRYAAGRPTLLHGLQVGIGTLLATTLHLRLRDWDPACFDWGRRRRTYPSWEQEVESIRSLYGSLTDAVLEEYAGKYQPWEQKQRQLERVFELWDPMREQLAPLLPERDLLRDTLRAAGAPTTAAELGLSRGEVVNALLWARCLRARYTVLDLAWELGLLDEWVEPVLRESAVG